MLTAWHFILQLLGIGLRPEQLDLEQVVLRALIIFGIALAFMRLGHKRSLARKTAFDTAFVVIFGAMLARAINGSGPFFPTIVAAGVLVLLHRLLGSLAEHSEKFENLIKGRPDELLRDGRVLAEKMRAHRISKEDLAEDMHLRGHADTAAIALARLERSGEISFIPRQTRR
ncbi:MAG TPA: YetF domain-containing protein [Chthoniobacterales bacterium]